MHDESTGLTAEINTEQGVILVRCFWTRDTYCIVDVRICDVNLKFYLTKNPSTIIKNAEAEKIRKYLDSCLEQRINFTPFVVS